jgi:hypothetical protein
MENLFFNSTHVFVTRRRSHGNPGGIDFFFSCFFTTCFHISLYYVVKQHDEEYKNSILHSIHFSFLFNSWIKIDDGIFWHIYKLASDVNCIKMIWAASTRPSSWSPPLCTYPTMSTRNTWPRSKRRNTGSGWHWRTTDQPCWPQHYLPFSNKTETYAKNRAVIPTDKCFSLIKFSIPFITSAVHGREQPPIMKAVLGPHGTDWKGTTEVVLTAALVCTSISSKMVKTAGSPTSTTPIGSWHHHWITQRRSWGSEIRCICTKYLRGEKRNI